MPLSAAIQTLKTLTNLVLPPLTPNAKNRGQSTIIKVTNTTICFKRGNSKKYVKICDLLNAYKHIPMSAADLEKYFPDTCIKTFFLQLLKYFNLATVIGGGKKGNPYSVI